MKRKLLLSIFLLLTGLFTVSCSNDSNVTINESQIEDAITAGLEKEPYKRGDISLTLAKCEIDYSVKNLSNEDIEILEKREVQEFIDEYAKKIGETTVEVGKPVKREYNQIQCKELRLDWYYLGQISNDYTKNYYKKSDGNYVIELTKVDLSVSTSGITNTLKTKDVITFDERSYIIHEETTTSMSRSGIDFSMKMETLAISDVVYYDSYFTDQELVEVDEIEIKNVISAGLEEAPYTSGEMDYIVEKVYAESDDIATLEKYKENLYTSIASSLCINTDEIEIGVQKQNIITQEECNRFRLKVEDLDSLSELSGQTIIKEFYKRVSDNKYIIILEYSLISSDGVATASNIIIIDDRSYIVHEESKQSMTVSYSYEILKIDTAIKFDINYK